MIIFEVRDEFYEDLALKYLSVRLDVLVDELNMDIETIENISEYFPPLTFIEKKDKCIKTVYKLKEWIKDSYYHYLGSLEKFFIARLFAEVDEERDAYGVDSFCLTYYRESKEELLKKIKDKFIEEIREIEDDNNEILTDDYILDLYLFGDVFVYHLFKDLDEEIICILTGGEEDRLYDIDPYYYDVMPEDIAKRAIENKSKANTELNYFMDSFIELIEKSYYRIKGFDEYNEKDFQILFDFYGRAYNCCSLEFNKVYRESQFGDGNADFIITFPYIGDILFELKMDNKSKVIHAITKQVPEYLKRLKKNRAILIIFSSKNNHNEEYMEISKQVYKEERLSVFPVIIDISKKNVPSKINN